MNITNIVDYQGNCISDYQGTCIILTTHVPIFGCGAKYARIWRVGIYHNEDPTIKREPLIKLISEL